MTKLKLRQTSKFYAFRKRFLRLSSNEQVQTRRYKQLIKVLLIKVNSTKEDEVKKIDYERALQAIIAKYYSILIEPEYILPQLKRLRTSIDDFSESECYINFRFLKKDLKRLCTLLYIPSDVILKNRICMTGEEVFLRALYELVSGDVQEKISSNVFGREFSAQSRSICWFISHVFNNFQWLVTDNLLWWKRNGYFEKSAEAIGRRMNFNVNERNLIAHMIDCNCLPTSVVGGGPTESGANSARWDDTIQRAFYNGWKSIHGLKHQTVDNAYGITVDLYGPTSLRRNDLCLLRESEINDRMSQAQLNERNQFIIFGDSAYKEQSHISSYYKGQDPNHVWENGILQSKR